MQEKNRKSNMFREIREDKAFIHKLITLVLPIAFQQFMLAVVSASDALMLGSLDQNAMSAVSLAGQIAFVENLFLEAMILGLSALAAQYWGKGDRAAVERIFAYVMKVTALVAFLFFLAGLFLPRQLMMLFTGEEALIRGGSEYLRVVALSYLLTGISQIYLCMMKNTDRAPRASLISSCSVVINIILNAVLIYGLFGAPRMEIAGAALATVLARVIEVSWCIIESLQGDHIRLKISNSAKGVKGAKCANHELNGERLRKDFWKYTTPILCNEMSWGIGFTMYSVIMGHLGSDAVAANSVATIVKNLIVCVCLGLGSGGGILLGNELGAGRIEKAKRYGDWLCALAIVCGAVSGILLLALSPFILSLVVLTPTAAGYLRWMLAMSSYYLIGKSYSGLTIGGIFCAGGDTRFGFLCDSVTMWCVCVPISAAAAFLLKLPVLAVFFLINLDEIVKMPVEYLHYKKYQWARNLTEQEKRPE